MRHKNREKYGRYGNARDVVWYNGQLHIAYINPEDNCMEIDFLDMGRDLQVSIENYLFCFCETSITSFVNVCYQKILYFLQIKLDTFLTALEAANCDNADLVVEKLEAVDNALEAVKLKTFMNMDSDMIDVSKMLVVRFQSLNIIGRKENLT